MASSSTPASSSKVPTPRCVRVEELLPFGHGNKAKMLMRHLAGVNAITEASGLKDPKLEKLRNLFITECEKAMDQPNWRQKVYPCLWKTAFYSTIVIYREALAKGESVQKFTSEYVEFTEKALKYLLYLQTKYPDISHDIYLHIGDMNRYSLDILKDPSKYNEALRYYSRAVAVAPQKGHSYNNIALLFNLQSKNNYWRSACLFLRSATADEPFTASMDSLKKMYAKLPDDFPTVQVVAIEYVFAMQEKFSSVILDGPLKKWQDAVTEELNKERPDRQLLVETFVAVVLGSMAAMIAKDHSENRKNYLIQKIGDDFKRFFKDVVKVDPPENTQQRIRRRFLEARARRAARQPVESESEDETEPESTAESLPQRTALGELKIDKVNAQNNIPRVETLHSGENSQHSDSEPSTEIENMGLSTSGSDSDSDSDESSPTTSPSSSSSEMHFQQIEGPDLNRPLLALLIEWFDCVDSLLKSRRMNVGLRMTLQSLLQLILDTANTYISEFNLSAPQEEESVSNRVIWMVKSPAINLSEDFFNSFLPVLLDEAKEWDYFPIMFDKYYKAAPKSEAEVKSKSSPQPEVEQKPKPEVKPKPEAEQRPKPEVKPKPDIAQGRALAQMQMNHMSGATPMYSAFPTHTLVDANVMTTRLPVIKAIAAAGSMILVTKSTMSKFDQMKSKQTEVRSAVRFLEQAMKSHKARIISNYTGEVYAAAHDFIEAEYPNDFNGLFLVMLPGDASPSKIAPLKRYRDLPVWTEGIDKFSERFAAQLHVHQRS